MMTHLKKPCPQLSFGQKENIHKSSFDRLERLIKFVLNIFNFKTRKNWENNFWKKKLCLSMTSNDDQKFRATDI